MTFEKSGTVKAYIFTTRGGVRYRFERVQMTHPVGGHAIGMAWVLTRISDRNDNRLTLHYESAPDVLRSNAKPRLAAVEDTQGRILKFHYHDIRVGSAGTPYSRYISKIEFGLGTPQALTTVYQTVTYSYADIYAGGSHYYSRYRFLSSVTHHLGSGDPRGSTLATQYEYVKRSGGPHAVTLTAIASPLGYRAEFDYLRHYRNYLNFTYVVSKVRVEDAPPDANSNGTVLYERDYAVVPKNKNSTDAYTKESGGALSTSKRYYRYAFGTNGVGALHYRNPHVAATSTAFSSIRASYYWSYSGRNVTTVRFLNREDKKIKSIYIQQFSFWN